MTLDDKDILELNELGNALIDETLTDAQRIRLSNWLAESEEARRLIVRLLGLSASLCSYAGEMHAEAPDQTAVPIEVRANRRTFPLWAGGVAIAAAAAIAIGAVFFWATRRPDPIPDPALIAFVARLTGSNGCVWANPAAAPLTGARLRKGQHLDLASGQAEVTFDSGAQVVLEGPASLDLNSPWDASLRQGTLKAYVPAEAIGFRISHPSVDVVDLGTEFSMVADASGAANVLVIKGEVEAAPRASSDQESILLRASESRRFARTGVSTVEDSARTFAWVSRPVIFDRPSSPARFAHWTFNDGPGSSFKADVAGLAPANYDLRLFGTVAPGSGIVHAENAGSRALRFDGALFARADFPGLSGNSTHTVAFWVKVPADAQLIDSFAMVAWGTTDKKFNPHPVVHIRWNRDPIEGPLGVLRTDFGGGSAMGRTPLLDGNWHHVAVIFSPGGEGDVPVQVKQYLDGRLESSSTNPPGRTTRLSASKEETRFAMKDVLWLGCRIGPNGIKQERFRGEIADLYIADRGLEPSEIVTVMRHEPLNRTAAAVALAE